MLEMMLEKEWSCNLFEIVPWNQSAPLSASCLNKVKYIIVVGEKAFETTSSVPISGVDPNYTPQ